MFTLYPTDTVGVGGVSVKATDDRLSASEYRSFTRLSVNRNVTPFLGYYARALRTCARASAGCTVPALCIASRVQWTDF